MPPKAVQNFFKFQNFFSSSKNNNKTVFKLRQSKENPLKQEIIAEPWNGDGFWPKKRIWVLRMTIISFSSSSGQIFRPNKQGSGLHKLCSGKIIVILTRMWSSHHSSGDNVNSVIVYYFSLYKIKLL